MLATRTCLNAMLNEGLRGCGSLLSVRTPYLEPIFGTNAFLTPFLDLTMGASTLRSDPHVAQYLQIGIKQQKPNNFTSLGPSSMKKLQKLGLNMSCSQSP